VAKITVGIPCYQNAPAETLEDYMRLMYYLGRRCREHEFFLAIKSKSEQFRARNAIVTAALQVGSDYIWMLDDDHVIDWEETQTPNNRYGMIKRLLGHLEADPELGIVGALYFHRGAECRPVIMKEGTSGGYYWMREDELTNGLQEVAVTGGGCMLIRSQVFDKIEPPWFQPEYELGTDVQICEKARKHGWKVACDTSITLGHVMTKRTVVTERNRLRIGIESSSHLHAAQTEGIKQQWKTNSAMNLYRMDVEEYLGRPLEAFTHHIDEYAAHAMKFASYDDPVDYYRAAKWQLVRQAVIHHKAGKVDELEMVHLLVPPGNWYGADIGCGASPTGFELVMSHGHRMTFIDVDGAEAYEFLKWRAKRRGVEQLCEWDWGEEREKWNYVLLLDAIEHWRDWPAMMEKIVKRLKPKGYIITNYFLLEDKFNPEHISMDKDAVKQWLIEHGIYPTGPWTWVKQDLGFMDRPAASAAA